MVIQGQWNGFKRIGCTVFLEWFQEYLSTVIVEWFQEYD